MTQQEIKDAHIVMTETGVMALVKPLQNGKVRVLREIKVDEVTAMVTALFMLFKREHPEVPVMQVPLGADDLLVISTVKKDK